MVVYYADTLQLSTLAQLMAYVTRNRLRAPGVTQRAVERAAHPIADVGYTWAVQQFRSLLSCCR